MFNLFKFFLTFLFKMIGKDTYKSLVSRPDFLLELKRVCRTFQELVKVKTDDDIVNGNYHLPDYMFIKSNLFNILSYKYVILNDAFLKKAVTNKNYRIIDFNFNIDNVFNFLTLKFDGFKLFNVSSNDDKTIEEEGKAARIIKGLKSKFDEITDAEATIMTPVEWNAFWNDMIELSREQFSLESLHTRVLTLNSIPGIITKDDDGNFEIRIFENENELPMEFMIACKVDSSKLSGLSPSKVQWTEDNIHSLYDVDSFMFKIN